MDNSDNPALELFEQVLDELQLEHAEIAARRMFGMRSLAVRGKAFAGLSGEDMIFRLDAGSEAHAKAHALPGAKAFDPMGGRPMKAWVQVPLEQSEWWLDLAEEALRSRLAGH